MKLFPSSRKNRILVIGIALILIIVGIYRSRAKAPDFTTVTAQRGTLVQEVSITGRVKPAQAVDLSFEQTGKVATLNVKIGDTVTAGQALAQLNAGDISAQVRQSQAGVAIARAQLAQYEAALQTQQAKLDELRHGAQPEELTILRIAVDTAQHALDDARASHDITTNKARTDLDDEIKGAQDSAAKSLNAALNAMYALSDIQSAHFYSNEPASNALSDAKASAVYILVGLQNAGRYSSTYISQAHGGVRALVEQSQTSPTQDSVTTAVSATLDALRKTSTALNAVPLSSSLTSTESTDLATQKTTIASEIVTLNSAQGSLTAQAHAYQTALLDADTKVHDAQNALDTARAQLALKQAGANADQIDAQRAQVQQAQANLDAQRAQVQQAQANADLYGAQLKKTSIVSPLNGIVTRQDAKLGQTVSPGAPLISVMTNATFHIEANVPEADIGKVKVSDQAHVTLDAYGDAIPFNAHVVAIDPAETLLEGVATYKTTLEFDTADDRVKSGMTANIDIIADTKENVIAIPQRAVYVKNGDKYVKILKGKTQIETMVTVGQRGPSGTIEIVQGVQEGDIVTIPSVAP